MAVKKIAPSAPSAPVKTVAKPVAKAPAPAPKAVAKSAPEPEAEEEGKSGKHIGLTTGMRVMAYQDYTMSMQHKNRWTDEELAADWQREFPNTRCRFEERPDIIRIVRKLFNEGRHGKQTLHTETPVPKYEIVNGKRTAVTEEPRKRGPKPQAHEAA